MGDGGGGGIISSYLLTVENLRFTSRTALFCNCFFTSGLLITAAAAGGGVRPCSVTVCSVTFTLIFSASATPLSG